MTITSAKEQAFIEATFLAGASEFQAFWIGLTDEAHEGSFAWVTGELLAYINWDVAFGEPNNSCRGQAENYVSVNWHHAYDRARSKGTWNDVPLVGAAACGSDVVPGPYYGIIEVEN